MTGAGFSALAGIPVQGSLLPLVIGGSQSVAPNTADQLAQATVIEFLNAVFLGHGMMPVVWPEDQERLRELTLEDVYTVIDKAISHREWLPEYGWQETADVRRALDRCVITYLRQIEAGYQGNDYYRLANRVCQNYDRKWATITLNWDTVWDRALQRALAPEGKTVDYGLRTPTMLAGDTAQPRLDPTFCLYKLHGSFNWLVCPRCHELLVISEAPEAPFPFGVQCPVCPSGKGGPVLEPMILTPTLLKSYENASLMRIWDKAVRALDQATDVMFVGYSFPLADHDFRYLLRRAVSARARLWVILHDRDRPKGKPRVVRPLLPEARYRGFFGLPGESFYYDGWEAFFDRVLPPQAG